MTMTPPKIGLITFGDERPHEWEKVFRQPTEAKHAEALSFFRGLAGAVNLYAFDDVARTRDDIDRQVTALATAHVEALVAHVPCWTAPNLVLRGVQRMGLPTILLSNKSAATHGTVGLLGAGGALDQIGYRHLRVREDFDNPMLPNKVLPFLRAAAAKERLRGEVFGLFGGRSLGIDTGTFDPMQWRALFGVDAEHIDQIEIIRRAERMPAQSAEPMTAWLRANVKSIGFNDQGLTPDKLNFQARCYLATREIIAEKGLDFVAVKCMPDLSNNHVPQCLSAAFVPSPYDADGLKEPIAMACEADADGALTMQVLKHVSGGTPPFFGDLSYLNESTRTLYLPNCGAICSWYASRSNVPAENLAQIELRPSVRPGGGAITYFKAAPGSMTLARLFRRRGRYHMAIIPGEAVTPTDEEYAAFVAARGLHQLPTAFVKVSADFDRIIAEYGANHIAGVAGSYVAELEQFCAMLDIAPIVLV
jgi:L-fucose isomerase